MEGKLSAERWRESCGRLEGREGELLTERWKAVGGEMQGRDGGVLVEREGRLSARTGSAPRENLS